MKNSLWKKLLEEKRFLTNFGDLMTTKTCYSFDRKAKVICRITDSGCKSGRQQQFFRIYISGVSIWHEKKTGKSKTDQLQRLHKFVNSPSRPLMSRFSLVKSIHSVSYSFQPSQKITQSYAY